MCSTTSSSRGATNLPDSFKMLMECEGDFSILVDKDGCNTKYIILLANNSYIIIIN